MVRDSQTPKTLFLTGDWEFNLMFNATLGSVWPAAGLQLRSPVMQHPECYDFCQQAALGSIQTMVCWRQKTDHNRKHQGIQV